MNSAGQQSNIPNNMSKMNFDPSTILWYESPAKVWEEALPVGNGRLGSMVFGMHSEERIQLNEETYWSGGPYSTVVKGGHKALPEIQRMIFEGNPTGAHKLFGRELMGYPVEQQKYQSIGNLHLFWLLVIFGGNSCGNPLGCQTLADAKHRFLPSDSWIGVPLECWES